MLQLPYPLAAFSFLSFPWHSKQCCCAHAEQHLPCSSENCTEFCYQLGLQYWMARPSVTLPDVGGHNTGTVALLLSTRWCHWLISDEVSPILFFYWRNCLIVMSIKIKPIALAFMYVVAVYTESCGNFRKWREGADCLLNKVLALVRTKIFG